MQLEAMYQEIILDHFRRPHHKGLREPYDVEVHHVNTNCGDEVTLRVKLDGDTVTDVSYETAGCSISQASASMLTDVVIGRDVETGSIAYREFLALMHSKGLATPDEEILEDAVAFTGVAKYPSRVKCALLSWMAWMDATTQAREKTLEPATGTSSAATSTREGSAS
jgi:nitrogen fixation NifU-like protein